MPLVFSIVELSRHLGVRVSRLVLGRHADDCIGMDLRAGCFCGRIMAIGLCTLLLTFYSENSCPPNRVFAILLVRGKLVDGQFMDSTFSFTTQLYKLNKTLYMIKIHNITEHPQTY
jgi:hypothetical protein